LPSGLEEKTGRSRALFRRAKKVFAGGVNHNPRLFEPYPLYFAKARGKRVWDEDGNVYTDYWMGHLALILGHSPRPVTEALLEQVPRGTHFGASSRMAVELGEEVQRSVPCAEMMRFCGSGAEATMYLVRLARGYTKKRFVVKMVGGWHGYNTELNKAVHSSGDAAEGKGIIEEEQRFVVASRFNDLEDLARVVSSHRRDVAAVLMEPVLGAGGCIPAEKEFVRGARKLCDEAGCLLAFDEVITGFRLGLGGAQEYYGVVPDIAALGKVVGGGLPVGLVCGKSEIVRLADPSRKEGFVSIGGGTFSENPLTMTAGLATLRYLRKNRSGLYGRLALLGESLRKGVDAAMGEAGVTSETTGAGSLFMTHVGGRGGGALGVRRTMEYAMKMMEGGVYILPGHAGAIASVHGREDVEKVVRLSRAYAEGVRGGRSKQGGKVLSGPSRA
jgi:glutamate-1-semialdehyde 2,1-aminomutase